MHGVFGQAEAMQVQTVAAASMFLVPKVQLKSLKWRHRAEQIWSSKMYSVQQDMIVSNIEYIKHW